jgi:hypothetical protein
MPAFVSRPTRATLLACGALALALLAGCGGGGGGGEVDVGPAAAVPENAALYIDGTVRPTGATEQDAKAALGKVFDTADPGGKIVSLIDREGSRQSPKERFTYAADIQPWLGQEAGAFFTSFSGEGTGAAVIETTNSAEALAFARKSESGATRTSQQGGTTVYTNPSDGDSFATAGDFLIFGDESAVKAAIDAQQGASLGDSGDFKDALGDLPDDRLGTLYSIPKDFIAALGPGQIDKGSEDLLEKSAGESLDQPVSGALTATSDSFNLELVGGDNGVDTPESALLGEVPAQSWLAIGFGDLGQIAKRTIEQLKQAGIPDFQSSLSEAERATGSSIDQLTGALGDAVLYVQGTTESTLTGGLIVETKDPDLSGRLLSQLQTLLQLGSGGGVKPLRLSGGGSGFRIRDASLGSAPVEIAQQGDKLVIGYGTGSAERSLKPAQTLADSPSFSAAKGQVSDLGTDLFLDFPSVLALAESSGAKSDPDYRQAKPYLDALTYLVSGSGGKGDQAELKAVLGLK